MKDLKDYTEIVQRIMQCGKADISSLHKFETKIGNNYIFRALINKKHILYAVTESKSLVFLRAFNNFKLYKSFLADITEIKNLLK